MHTQLQRFIAIILLFSMILQSCTSNFKLDTGAKQPTKKSQSRLLGGQQQEKEKVPPPPSTLIQKASTPTPIHKVPASTLSLAQHSLITERPNIPTSPKNPTPGPLAQRPRQRPIAAGQLTKHQQPSLQPDIPDNSIIGQLLKPLTLASNPSPALPMATPSTEVQELQTKDTTLPAASQKNYTFALGQGRTINFSHQPNGTWQAHLFPQNLALPATLPVVCEQGQTVATALQLLRDKPTPLYPHRIHVLVPKQAPYQACVYVGKGLRGGDEKGYYYNVYVLSDPDDEDRPSGNPTYTYTSFSPHYAWEVTFHRFNNIWKAAVRYANYYGDNVRIEYIQVRSRFPVRQLSNNDLRDNLPTIWYRSEGNTVTELLFAGITSTCEEIEAKRRERRLARVERVLREQEAARQAQERARIREREEWISQMESRIQAAKAQAARTRASLGQANEHLDQAESGQEEDENLRKAEEELEKAKKHLAEDKQYLAGLEEAERSRREKVDGIQHAIAGLQNETVALDRGMVATGNRISNLKYEVAEKKRQEAERRRQEAAARERERQRQVELQQRRANAEKAAAWGSTCSLVGSAIGAFFGPLGMIVGGLIGGAIGGGAAAVVSGEGDDLRTVVAGMCVGTAAGIGGAFGSFGGPVGMVAGATLFGGGMAAILGYFRPVDQFAEDNEPPRALDCQADEQEIAKLAGQQKEAHSKRQAVVKRRTAEQDALSQIHTDYRATLAAESKERAQRNTTWQQSAESLLKALGAYERKVENEAKADEFFDEQGADEQKGAPERPSTEGPRRRRGPAEEKK